MGIVDQTLASQTAGPSRYRWTILTVVIFGQVLISGFFLAWGALAPFLLAEFDLTRAQVGMIVGATAAGSSLASTPFGRVGDRIGARRMLTAGLIAMGTLAVIVGLSQ